MDRLVDAALAGTASIGNRQIAGNTPTAALVAQLSDLSPARRLLLAAGTQALYTQAGRAVGPPVAAPAPAPPDRLPVCSTGAARLLDQLLDQDSAGILPEALGRLARVGQRLPPPLLVAALTAGKRRADLRPALLPVLDARGHWLASRNPDWAWATSAVATIGGELPPDAEAIWQEGNAP